LKVTVVTPEAAAGRIEPNIVRGPGPPGAVDKGEREERGQRLAVSTATPVKEARFMMLFKVE
jgi:hypothetical protein